MHHTSTASFKSFTSHVSLSVLGMVGISVYILADTLFIAQAMGEYGLAALNLAIPLFSIVNGWGLMVGIGAATRFTVLKAQGDEPGGSTVFSHAFALTVVSGLILSVIGWWGAPLLAHWMGARGTVALMTTGYLQILLLFSPLFLFNNLFTALVRNDGNPKLSMAAMVVGSFANIGLDYLFIFPLEMGMRGAALATATAPLVSLAILSLHMVRKHHTFFLKKFLPDWRVVIRILHVGLTSFVTEMASGVVLVVFNTTILALAGTTGLAAYGVIANVALVVIAIFTGMAQGIQPLVSQLYGWADYPGMRKLLRYGLLTALGLAGVIYLASWYWSHGLIAAFNSDNSPQLAAYALQGLRIYFLGFFFAGANVVGSAFLSAREEAGRAFRISLLRSFVLILPTVLLLSRLWEMPGVWWSFVVTEALTSVYLVYELGRSQAAKGSGDGA